MRYEVDFIDDVTGATSAIDNITADANYTAEKYIADCKANADDEWNTIFTGGTVKLVPLGCRYEYYGERARGLEPTDDLDEALANGKNFEVDVFDTVLNKDIYKVRR